MSDFSKNWKQVIVSQGEPFQIEYLDRSFGRRPRVVLRVDDLTGEITVNGRTLDGSQNFTGDVVVDGDVEADNLTATETVTAADLVATDDLTVGDDAAITGDATIGGTLGVTGVTTFTGQARLPASSFASAVVAAGNGAGARTLTGAAVGDHVIACINLTDNADANASFENTITVADQIQQSATDLTGDAVFVMLAKQS